MFRESDIRARKPHMSYTSRGVPLMQQQANVAKFNEFRNDELVARSFQPGDTVSHEVPEIIPPTVDVRYDPDHPDADWHGFVSKNIHHRKHSIHHPSLQIGVQQSELGIVGINSPKNNLSGKRKPLATTNSSSVVIGGIDDPNSHWKSSYQRFTSHEATDKSQLNPKKIGVPRKIMNNYNTSSISFGVEENVHANILSNPTTRRFTNQSLLSNIGELIAPDIDTRKKSELKDTQLNSSLNFPMDSSRPLITQTYRKNLPGYTGYRQQAIQ